MPVWVWVLLVLSALGFVLWLLDERMELDATAKLGKALAVLFILAMLIGLVLSFVNADWR
jgi:hypothetical protein